MIKLTPYVRVFNSKGELMNDRITQFTYKYSEENDDECVLEMESDDPLIADNPSLQEGQKLSVEWGYIDTGESVSRIVYIFETVTEYGDTGVKLSITCHEKFALVKMNKASTGMGTNQTSKNANQVIALGAEVIEALQISVVTEKSPASKKFVKELGMKFNEMGNKIKLTNSGWIDDSTSKDAGYQPNQNVGLTYNKGSQVVKDVDLSKGYPDMVYFNATSSSYKTMRKYLDKLPGGPFVIDSRDDSVTIRTRNFNQDPVRNYTYKGEDGELLSFTPESKNRQHARGSSKTSATSWDAKRKASIKSTADKYMGTALADKYTETSLLQGIWNRFPGSRPFNKEIYLGDGKPKPVQKARPMDYNGGYNIMENEHYRGKGVSKDVEAAERIGMAKTNGKAKPPKDYQKQTVENDEGKIVEVLEVYELGGAKPARSRKLDGNFIAAQDGVSNPNAGSHGKVMSYGPNRYTVWGLKYDDQNGTPENSKQLGNEGNDAANKAFGLASNSQAASQLENNPASARVIGNPYLVVGTLITISNVSKKHSGNYYVKEVEHQIGNDGYNCTISKLTRQGTRKSTQSVGVQEAATDGFDFEFGADKEKESVIDSILSTAKVNNKIGPDKQEGFPVNTLAGAVTNITIGPNKNILQTIPSREA